jgi:C1A family cysteine protease
MAGKKKFSFLVEKNTGKKIRLGGVLKSTQKPPKAKNYCANRFSPKQLPSKVDLRPYLTQVEDQSAVGSCVANSLVGAYEYLAKRQLGDSGDVSRLFVYYFARVYDGSEGEDVGCTITNAIKVLEEYGSCTEETWPYDLDLVNETPDDDAVDEASNFLIEEANEINIDLYEMKHCLAEGFPFVFALKLFKTFDHARKKGIVPIPKLNSEEGRESHGNHAMLCVGYLDNHKLFIVRNSWGEDWGDKGYCYIPYEYMTNPELCWDCWAIRNVSDLDFSADVWAEDDEDDDYYDYDEDDYDEDDEYEYEDDEDYDEDEDDEDYDEDDEDYDEDEDDEDYDEDEDDEDYDEDEDDEDYDEDEDDEDYDEDEDDED